MAENVTIIELLGNPFSVCPLHNKLRTVNKDQPAPPLSSVITHHKTKTEQYTRLFASLSMKRVTG
jgi:hypothetical protein